MSENASQRLIAMFEAIHASIDAERDHLSELDGAIGDGDHGITMALGFKTVCAALARLDAQATGADEVMRTAAMAFLNAVGASTGPLYAAALNGAGGALSGRDMLDGEAIAAMLTAIGAGIQRRGKGQRGDKTMLDVWLPAAEAATAAAADGATAEMIWRDVILAAEAGANATRSMIAAKGRAARLRERSLGHIDPGAASAVLILRAMAASLGDA